MTNHHSQLLSDGVAWYFTGINYTGQGCEVTIVRDWIFRKMKSAFLK
jgi:hypothetical protein